ncbi:Gfo/Idh/MocA family oxidoreductase [Candidatus Sumerlaeota bacterium]|nr:Gfo/Idh/MocA family oxidoreductase [Candidatus Sumerlaeota bacterium]
MQSHDLGRREFIKAGAAAGALAMSAASYARIIGANERVQVGCVGIGNRGGSLLEIILKSCPSAQVMALCDVYKPYLDFAKSQAPAAADYSDYRKLLEDKHIDAVVIATPDHWHALTFIDSCDAGKDVYVEKPLSLTVQEGRAMVRAAEKNKSVTQMGAQRHSSAYIIEACKLMREGGIGKITRVRCFHLTNEFPNGIGRRVASNPPPGLDWKMWLGPARERDFESVIWNYKFRWFWDFSGGQMTNFGTHWIDVIQMALGEDAPQSVAALGGKFAVADDREIPDTMEAVWQYKDCLVTFSQINANGADASLAGAEMEFRGTNGTLYIYGNRYEIVPEEIQDSDYPARGPLNRDKDIKRKKFIEKKLVKGGIDQEGHLRNFFDCVKSRAKCNCDVETGHRSTTSTLIANIAYRTASVLKWDRENERFTNSHLANKFLGYKYHGEWRIPVEYDGHHGFANFFDGRG